jgi:hypothetical protein
MPYRTGVMISESLAVKALLGVVDTYRLVIESAYASGICAVCTITLSPI